MCLIKHHAMKPYGAIMLEQDGDEQTALCLSCFTPEEPPRAHQLPIYDKC